MKILTVFPVTNPNTKQSNLRDTLQDVFNNPDSRSFVVTNDFLAIITVASVLAIILETVPSLARYEALFLLVEYVSVAIFTVEYIGRYVAAERKRDYTFSFFGFVDLLAILPTFVGLMNLTFLKTARVLRIMRFLRIVRLSKIARLRKQRHTDVEDAAGLYKLNVVLYFSALFGATLVLGALIYIFEASHGTFASIPEGMKWALETILGGSISQTYPETTGGEIVSILARFTGLVLLGLLIAVIGTSVRKALFGTEELTISTK